MNEPAAAHHPPGDPATGDGPPAFRRPWEAHAFAIVVMLNQRGVFSWAEWSESLGRCIGAAQRDGDPDLGDTYYLHWLAALEALVARKGLGSAAELGHWRDAWDHAAHRTPHGRPIELRADDFDHP
jgi:nitrile hydratase accessory protein